MTDANHRALDRAVADLDPREMFGERVRRYQDAAFATAYAILKDRAAAEDATQAAFLSAWLRRHDLREPLAFGSWLRTIVRTECFRLIRRKQWPMVPLDEALPLPAAAAPDELSRMELRGVLTEAVGTLSESERTVIVLRYLSDLSYQEMSAYLEIPLSTVKKRLHDARKGLLRWLTTAAAGDRARTVLREYRPSRDARLQERVMTITAFLQDVMQGHTAAVAAALDDHPDLLDATGGWKPLWTGTANALYVAAVCGRADIVRLLLTRGAHLEPETPADISPLVGAAIEGRADVVSILLEAGAQVDLWAACALGDAVRATRLLAGHPDLARARAADGKTPLHFCRSVDVARRVLAAGARPDLEAVDDAGLTALQWIGLTGRYQAVCDYLIAQGATAAPLDIFTACACGDLATVAAMIDQEPALVSAPRPGGPGIPRASIGWTPLHLAASRGDPAIATLLIQRGARVNARAGEHAVAPLHAAAAAGHTDVAQTLIVAGADVHLQDGAFRATPAEWARFFGHDVLADGLQRVTP